MHTNSLDKQNVLWEQKADTFCGTLNPGTYSSRSEFFLGNDGVIYRRQRSGKHQLVIPLTLVKDVIRENHEHKFVAHPGQKRTYSLISLSYWWLNMRKTIESFVRECDPCQRHKENQEPVSPLGDVKEPRAPYEITSMGITGPYPTTPRGNRYLLTFTDNFTRFVEAFPISNQTANTCAKIYASQIINRHGTGSTLVMDQGKAFMSTFFQATCKMLGISRIRTSALHPASNRLLEHFHRSLHAGLSHYINATNTNWDVAVPYILMAYRATLNTTTGFRPFYLLRGREMNLPTSDDLKAKLPQKKVQIKNKA
jgi:hypothetical protein